MSKSNKATIEELFAAFGEGRWSEPEHILRNMADDGEWWVAGTMPLSGTMTKAKLMETMKGTGAMTDGGLKITPKSWVVDGDKVSVEAESLMHLRNGKTYNNHYHFAFAFKNGKIQSVREYMDTQHAAETLLG